MVETHRVPELIDLDSTPFWLKLLLYGPYNSGKTHLAGTAEDHEDLSPVLLIRAEEGSFTVRGKGVKSVKRVKSVKEFDAIFWALVNNKPPYDEIRTVVLDSGTALVQTVVEEVVAKNVRDSKKDKDPDLVSIRDWGQVNFILRKRFRDLYELPKHVIVTALDRLEWKTDDAEERAKQGPSKCIPDFPPKLGRTMMASADFVWSLTVDDSEKRALYTRAHKDSKQCSHAGKTRGDAFRKVLPPKVEGENMSLPRIWNLMKQAQLETSTTDDNA